MYNTRSGASLAEFVKVEDMNEFCPQEVIKFYELRLKGPGVENKLNVINVNDIEIMWWCGINFSFFNILFLVLKSFS